MRQGKAGLNQQALGALVEPRRRRRGGSRERETWTVNYRRQSKRNVFFNCEPMQGKTIERQYPRLPHQYWPGTKGVLARSGRGMIRAIGMRIAGLVHMRGGGVRLCSFIGVIAGNKGSNRFAARKY